MKSSNLKIFLFQRTLHKGFPQELWLSQLLVYALRDKLWMRLAVSKR